MSKLKRLLGALSLVALTVFSSCVDDEVAPEVAALRQAQVDLLNAEVAYQNALTAFQDALTATENAITANQLLLNERQQITNDEAASALLVAIATDQAAIATQEAALVAAQQALAVAEADLAQYLATAGLQDAAYYLKLWEDVYFGGTNVAVLDIEVPANGLLGVTAQINALSNEIAVDELFIGDDSTSFAYQDAALAADLVAAQTAVETRTTMLAAKEAALAELLANDGLAAIAVLEESIIPLRDATIAARADSTAAAKALAAAEAGPDAALQAIVDDFIEEDDDFEADFTTGGERVNYQMASAQVTSDSAGLTQAIADTVIWWNYADSLQGIHDAFYEPYIVDYEAQLDAAIADTVATWEALDGVTPTGDLESPVIDAYNNYIVLARRIFDQNYGEGHPSYPGEATEADTVAWGNAREDWDGLNIAALLGPGGSGDALDLTAIETTNNTFVMPGYDYPYDIQGESKFSNSDGAHWVGARTDGQAISGGAGDPDAATAAIGGATKEYYDQFVAGGEQAEHNEAKARLAILQDQYFLSVQKFTDLQTYINEVKAGTNDEGEFPASEIPDAPTFITNFGQFDAFVALIEALNEELGDDLSDEDYASLCDAWYATIGKVVEGECPFYGPGSDIGDANYPDAESAWDAVDDFTDDLNGTSTTEGSLSNLAFIIDFYGQDVIDEFEAAVASLAATTQAEYDAITADIAAALAESQAANSALAAAEAAEGDIISDIQDIFADLDTEFVANSGSNGEQVIDTVRFTETVSGLEQDIADLSGVGGEFTYGGGDITPEDGASIEDAEVDVEKLTNAVSLNDQSRAYFLVQLEEKRQNLAILQTELTVLQALADELEALVLAALAG